MHGFGRWIRLNLAIGVLGAPEGHGWVAGRVAGPRVRQTTAGDGTIDDAMDPKNRARGQGLHRHCVTGTKRRTWGVLGWVEHRARDFPPLYEKWGSIVSRWRDFFSKIFGQRVFRPCQGEAWVACDPPTLAVGEALLSTNRLVAQAGSLPYRRLAAGRAADSS